YVADPTPTPICTLSLHDALPIFLRRRRCSRRQLRRRVYGPLPRIPRQGLQVCWCASSTAAFVHACHSQRQGVVLYENCRRSRKGDRKSTRLNSSHVKISYAVFCL